MFNKEVIKIISKPWANVNDISKLASCCRDRATEIRNAIYDDIRASGKFIPRARSIIVPMDKVIDYLGINIEHAMQMVLYEQKLNK